jgi:immune inhibitor A
MEENNSSGSKVVWTIVGVVIALLCCCLLIATGAGVWLYQNGDNILNTFDENLNISTSTPSAPIVVERPPAEEVPVDTLETLKTTIVPENDPYELACRLEGKCGISNTVEGKSYEVGDKDNFWVLNSDTVEYRQIEATLLYATPHSYFWAEDGTDADPDEVKTLMDIFEEEIYPTDREFFGSEWNPGVDGDPHIYVFYAKDLGSNIAGVYNSTDGFNPAIKEHSNAHESFVISATQSLTAPYTYGVLAHEFVHMIQSASDRNDVSWMGEGFAELGSFLNGYYSGGADWLYVNKPDIQLTDWADNSSPDFSAHYGQSFLYLAYYLDRFGSEATKALTNNPKNDIQSIDDTLEEMNITDPQTGEIITADDILMDWAVTMHLLDASVGDGRYIYNNYPTAPQTSATETFSNCPQTSQDRSVHQYGIDYISIQCAGDYTFHFDGATQTGLLPSDAFSGEYAFWSNKGDESDMTLTREFDLSSVAGPVTLSFQTWYDIEEDWDYVYLEASTDGESWEILNTPLGTDYNPAGSSYGWAYTGQTSGWVEENVDLSAYAGKRVQIRFEYITDAAVNGEGMLIDDIRIDAIDYFSDFESDDGGWESAGFARVQNTLPQTFRVALILKGDDTTVETIELSADQVADIPISLGDEYDEAIIIVSGTTRFTRGLANYSIEIK